MVSSSPKPSLFAGWLRRSAGFLLFLPAALGVAIGACSSNDPGFNNVPSGSTSSGATSSGQTSSSSGGPVCKDGDTKACSVTLGEHNGILSCFHGETTCVNGQWGYCTDPPDGGSGHHKAPPNGSGSKVDDHGLPILEGQDGPHAYPYALSAPQMCSGNPCDPTCISWTEQPDGGIHPMGTLTGNISGNLSDLPPGLVNKGIHQPCQVGGDCQFDHFCANPDYGSCAHDMCEQGAPLTNGCSACVSRICAAGATAHCCNVGVSFPSCSHTPCQTGGRLKSSCNPHVASVCSQFGYGYCCWKFGIWDQNCVNLFNAMFPADCSGGGNWDQACVDAVYTECDDYCQNPAPAEPHSTCALGIPLDDSLDSCVDTVCNGLPALGWAGDPNCCNVAWNATCVTEAQQYCDLVCGECVQWPHAGSDPNASGWDLTLGVACANSVPVCNRGNVNAPAGININYYPGNSQLWPDPGCTPSGAPEGTCTTAVPIPPGQCVSVPCAFPAGQHEVMANPNGPGHVGGEDFCENNWTLVDTTVACNPAACSSTGSNASFRPVDMFVTIDKSGSMNQPGRWVPAMQALTQFYQDPASAGLGVAQRFWPDDVPSVCDDPSCSQANCASPSTPWGTLIAAPAPADAQEAALIADINAHSPGGATPMSAALDGATAAAIARQIAFPSHKVVVVMITDGQPNGCNNSVNAIAGIAAAAFASPQKIQTYVIGIAGVSQSTIDQIATAGGGQSFFIAANTNTSAQLLSAMQAIRGNNTTCTFPLPNLGGFDPSKGQVTYSTNGMPANTGTQVANAGACGPGLQWYYDNNQAPTTITLCPAFCTTVQGDATAVVQVTIGCPTIYQPATTSQVYAGSCQPGFTVQWGFLTYDVTTPSDSSVTFQGRFGTTAAAAAVAAPINLSNAGTPTPINAANQNTLAIAGPPPTHQCQNVPTNAEVATPPWLCPVDIYGAAMLPAAQMSYLQLDINTQPSTDLLYEPTVNSWQVTYSCVPSE